MTEERKLSARQVLELLDPDEIEQQIAELQGEIAALKQLQKVALARAGRASAGEGGSATGDRLGNGDEGRSGSRSALREDRRGRIVAYLSEHGPTSVSALALHCRIPMGSMASVLDDPRFGREGSKVVLARSGK